MTEKITIKEIKELLKENKVQPQAIFSEEELLADPTVVLHVQKAVEEGKIPARDEMKLKEEVEEKARKEEEEKKKADEKKKAEEENELIPDVDPKGEPSNNELIPN